MKPIPENRRGSEVSPRATNHQPQNPDQRKLHRNYSAAVSLYLTICFAGIVIFSMGFDTGRIAGCGL